MQIPQFPFNQDILQFGAAGFFLACFILAFLLIRGARPERHKLIYTFFFLTFIAGVILLLAPLISAPVPTPTSSSEWTYFATDGGPDAAVKLTLAGPEPKDVAATLFKGHEFRVWYRGGGSGYKFSYKDLAFDPANPAAYEVFYNNGRAVPIGFGGKNDSALLYFAASK